jgi:carbamoyl-phosphate synthase large subunit
MITVLVTTAGSVSGINCINALKNQDDLELKIIASDASQYAAGLYLADRYYIVPPFENEEDYINSLLNICQKEAIDVILPIFSSEIPIIAKYIEEFRDRKVNLCISPLSSIKIFANKWNAFLFFKEIGIDTPETWLLNFVNDVSSPIYVKPITGSGSRKNHVVLNKAELNLLKSKVEQDDYIAQLLMKSKEYTVDVLANNDSRVLSLIPRERIITKDGLAIVSRTVEEPGVDEIIERLVKEGKLVGTFNIQYFKTQENKFLVFDVNTRFAAGGLPLSIKAGINFPLETIKLALGRDVHVKKAYKRNLTMIRYYTELFLE